MSAFSKVTDSHPLYMKLILLFLLLACLLDVHVINQFGIFGELILFVAFIDGRILR
jgi:hypothetical protein